MHVSHRSEVGHSSPEVLQLLMHHAHLELNLCPGRGIHRQLQRYLQVLQRTYGFLSVSSEPKQGGNCICCRPQRVFA